MKLTASNSATKTTPAVLHAQGMYHNQRECDHFKQIEAILHQTSPKATSVDQLSIITVTNYETLGSLEKSLFVNQFDMNRFHKLGAGITNFELDMKLALIKDQLGKIKTKYVMYCDSHDVLVLSLDRIIGDFATKKCKMLFNQEPFFWPKHSDFWKVQENLTPEIINKSKLCNLFIEEIEYKLAGNKHAYLNSGVWIAETDYARWVIDECLKLDLFDIKFWHGSQVQTQDQIFYRVIYRRNNTDIKLDLNSDIFQTLKESEIIDGKKTYDQRFNLEVMSYTIR